ncbi:hypothetical protein [Streptomyces sp. NPDC002328]|uniref:hypothetical protein n=1 Tax=Streptomyces sp. NPDC002328 TaxID=3364642 RepID=UPI0036A9A443
MAGQIERNYIREKALEGQVIAASKGNHGGRPKVIDDDMLTFAVALKDKGVPVPDIAKRLTIKTGKNAGKSPSVASLYRALAPRTPRPTTACRCGPGPSASADPKNRSPPRVDRCGPRPSLESYRPHPRRPAGDGPAMWLDYCIVSSAWCSVNSR